MVTLSLFVIFGMLGLAVDLGWSYFQAKAARTAADAAALAAAKAGFATYGAAYSSYPTSGIANCSSLSSGALYAGCQYASQNGFTDGTTNTRVRIEANTTSPYTLIDPNAPAGSTIAVDYWVRVRVAESIPQLFSAMLGHTTGTASAFGTAAVTDVIVNGALILLDQQNDCAIISNKTACGLDLYVHANDGPGNTCPPNCALKTVGNVLLSSSCNGVSSGPNNCTFGTNVAYAGVNDGGGTVYTLPAGTSIQGSGGVSMTGSSRWISTPQSGGTDGFTDPIAPKGVPPLAVNSLGTVHAVPGGSLDGYCSSNVCSPGYYYASTSTSNTTPTGAPLTASTSITFGSSGSFNQFVFFGGMQLNGTSGGKGGTTYTFNTGQYIYAGVQSGSTNPAFSTGTNVNLVDGTSSTGPNSDAGEMFIFTNPTSSGSPIASLVSSLPSTLQNMQFGGVTFASGNNGTAVNLHGLNTNPSTGSSPPSALNQFNDVLFYQDKNNIFGATSSNSSAPQLTIPASPTVHLYGVVYQPKGAWTLINGGGNYSGPLQLITGALELQGGANIDLTAPSTPLKVTKVALIE